MKTKIQKLVNVAKKHKTKLNNRLRTFTETLSDQFELLRTDLLEAISDLSKAPTRVESKSGLEDTTEPSFRPEDWIRLRPEEQQEQIQKYVDSQRIKRKKEMQDALEKREKEAVNSPRLFIRESGVNTITENAEITQNLLSTIKVLPMRKSMLTWELIAKKSFPDVYPHVKKRVDDIMAYEEVYLEPVPETYDQIDTYKIETMYKPVK
jgi:hypothetical protein